MEPLSREEYLDQIHKHILLAAETGIDLVIMHPLRLSLFFIICSIATLLDTDATNPVATAEEWHHLSKAAASLGSLMDEPSLVGTKTVVSYLISHGRQLRNALSSLLWLFITSCGTETDLNVVGNLWDLHRGLRKVSVFVSYSFTLLYKYFYRPIS